MISKKYLDWSQILLISLIGIYDMISVWRTLCIVISRGRDRIKTWITQTKKTQEINHNIKIRTGHYTSIVPRKIRLWETWQLYSVKFSTVGPTRGEDGKNCTKAPRGEKIKLAAQHSLLVSKLSLLWMREELKWMKGGQWKGMENKASKCQNHKDLAGSHCLQKWPFSSWPQYLSPRGECLVEVNHLCS